MAAQQATEPPPHGALEGKQLTEEVMPIISERAVLGAI